MTPEDFEALRLRCPRALLWHGNRTAADALLDLPSGIAKDRYGDGGIVADLEARVADLLGKEAAMFVPTGTMAQQIALRIHADRRDTKHVAFHPTCHLELHEERAHEVLHGLVGRLVGDADRLITLADLEAVTEPLAALLLELPQREIGAQLPSWEELTSQVAWARDQGVATHLDGARLWQCPAAYGRSLDQIAALFDTVYVSFYKDLGAMTGACLVGPADVIDEARTWRHRHGGTLFAMWPLAASALDALDRRLPRMPDYRAQAMAIAGSLQDLDGVRLTSNPPHTSMMLIELRGDPDVLRERMIQVAENDGISTWSQTWPTDDPAWQKVELTVGDATLGFTADEVREVLAKLVG